MHTLKPMAVKVLVTAIGQQLVAEVKQIENKDTNAIVGYWLTQPRTVNYNQDDQGNLGVNFGPYCPISNEAEFSIRSEHIVAILEPREDVVTGWNNTVYPQPAQQALETISTEDIPGANTTEPPVTDDGTNDTGADVPQDGTNPGLTE